MRSLDHDEALIERLKTHDTPTICNAIEVAQGRRGFDGFTQRTMHWSAPSDRRIVGFARTARIAGRLPPQDPPEVIRSRRMEYFRSMANGPRPGIAVVEDMDGDAAFGAWWGEIHAQIHDKVFGLNGAVTNGVMRDLDDMPQGFPVLAGAIGPSHGFVHVQEIGTPVQVFGMTVHEGDLIHADRHGAVNIPSDVQDTLIAALDRLLSSEAIVLYPLQEGPVDFAQFEALWARFERART
ncbi:RraA family protein [Antarctobacter sp.]|uniref:RraA family protein n=1 Tax=Antarctobacter sp. TaxID=1872577 RepID=UPI002B277DCC|nr:RraA family protein [Antarctobacter sp.]